MLGSEAKKTLKPGSRVRWKEDGALGTVRDTNWQGAQIVWDDGTAGIFLFAHNEPQWSRIERLGIKVPV